MIFLEIKMALTQQDYELAERLLAEDNRTRERPWDLALWLGGIASHATQRRLAEIEKLGANREEEPVRSAAPAAAD